MNRREFARLALAGLGVHLLGRRALAGNATDYHRANTDWLAKCRFGIGVHWTAQTVPRRGEPVPFQRAVEAFKLKEFIEQVQDAGADYVLFTATHALHLLPAPHPVLDRILPGRTCERDLIGELADALAACGLPLLVYWNHSCNAFRFFFEYYDESNARPRFRCRNCRTACCNFFSRNGDTGIGSVLQYLFFLHAARL